MLLGERLARAALGLVYGKAVAYRAPDLATARRVEAQRIVLDFLQVESRIDCIDPLANCFKVEDERGAVEITQVVYPMDTTVELVLERPLQGKAVLHGGWGTDPQTVPMDMERFLPILGFYGVQIADK
jgi:hypothetical protein